MPLKAIVFDRDGTLNEEGDMYYRLKPDDIKLCGGAKQALSTLRKANVLPLVFTQQSCIGKGLLSEEGLQAIHVRINELLGPGATIEKFYHCPHLAEEGCSCRKPKPGMLVQAMADFDLAPEEVLVVGDAPRDAEAAQAAGLNFAYVKNDMGKYTDVYANTGLPVYDNLNELVPGLLT